MLKRLSDSLLILECALSSAQKDVNPSFKFKFKAFWQSMKGALLRRVSHTLAQRVHASLMVVSNSSESNVRVAESLLTLQDHRWWMS